MNITIKLGLCVGLMASLGAMDAEVLSLNGEETDELMQVSEDESEPVVITEEEFAEIAEHIDISIYHTIVKGGLPYRCSVIQQRGFDALLKVIKALSHEGVPVYTSVNNTWSGYENLEAFCSMLQAADFLGADHVKEVCYRWVNDNLFAMVRHTSFIQGLLAFQILYPTIKVCDLSVSRPDIDYPYPPTVLMVVVNNRKKALFDLMVTAGVNLNQKDVQSGNTALIDAIRSNNLEGVTWLCEAGVDLEQPFNGPDALLRFKTVHNCSDDTPIMVALKIGTTKGNIVYKLVESGAYIDEVLEWVKGKHGRRRWCPKLMTEWLLKNGKLRPKEQ